MVAQKQTHYNQGTLLLQKGTLEPKKREEGYHWIGKVRWSRSSQPWPLQRRSSPKVQAQPLRTSPDPNPEASKNSVFKTFKKTHRKPVQEAASKQHPEHCSPKDVRVTSCMNPSTLVQPSRGKKAPGDLRLLHQKRCVCLQKVVDRNKRTLLHCSLH